MDTKRVLAATRISRITVACGLSALVSGCLAPAAPVPPAEPALYQVRLSKAQTLQAARRVLLGCHFQIEKEDLDAGYLRTYPLAGAQFFEFWRQDARSGFGALESNLHSIRRIAEIHLEEQATGTTFSCRVRTERLSLPGQAIESSSQAYQMLSDSGRGSQRLTLTPAQEGEMDWIDLGPDVELAEHIAREILKQ